MRHSGLISLFLCIMTFSCKSITSDVDFVREKTDSLLTSLYHPGEPGAVVLILKGDSVVFEKGYGIADMDSQSAIDGNTFFNIASVSKQFSAVALLMLAQEGKLSLDDNLEKWFPEFNSPLMKRINLRHLLSHTSGIPDTRARDNREFVLYSTDKESYAYIGNLKELSFEPGTKYEYMNPTFQLMYTIIERASGISFDNFMKSRIFDPAGMEHTTYFEDGKLIPNMAHGYRYNKENKSFEQFDYGEESFFATKADGGIYTSVREFVKWELALRSDILISEELRNIAHSPKIAIDEIPNTSYGYGWFIEKREGFPEKVYHTGNNGGFQIFAGRFPEKKILYLIFANRDDKNREEYVEKLDNILKRAGWFN